MGNTAASAPVGSAYQIHEDEEGLQAAASEEVLLECGDTGNARQGEPPIPVVPEPVPLASAGDADDAAGAAAASALQQAPVVVSLSADDPGMQARDRLFQQQQQQHTPLWEAQDCAQPGFDAIDAAAARQAAYLQRKEARLNKMKKNTLSSPVSNSATYLSNVPEVEADVQYRFTFLIAGGSAGEVAANTCKSRAALVQSRVMPAEVADPDLCDVQSPTSRSNTPAMSSFRCLCPVRPPQLAALPMERPKLAKLVFHLLGEQQDVPRCANRQDALGMAMVFVLTVGGLCEDGTNGTSVSVADQLQAMQQTISRMRSRSRARFRPVRAVVLVYDKTRAAEDGAAHQRLAWPDESATFAETDRSDPQTGPPENLEPALTGHELTHNRAAPAGGILEDWAALLADFERDHGQLWKFGPIAVQDGEVLHAAFTEMASVRILQRQTGEPDDVAARTQIPTFKEESDSEGDEGLPEDKNAGDATNEPPWWASEGRDSGGSVRSVSESSEGWHRPPCYATEMDGSDVSESDLERHRQVFGTAAQE